MLKIRNPHLNNSVDCTSMVKTPGPLNRNRMNQTMTNMDYTKAMQSIGSP